MAIGTPTLQGNSGTTATTPISVTMTGTPASGDIIVAFTGFRNTTGPPAITISGGGSGGGNLTWQPILSSQITGNTGSNPSLRAQAWWAVADGSTTPTVTATCTGATGGGLGLISFTVAAGQVISIAQQTSNYDANADNVVTLGANPASTSLLIAFQYATGGNTGVAATSFTAMTTFKTAGTSAPIAYSRRTGTTSPTISFTSSNITAVAFGIEIVEASAGGGASGALASAGSTTSAFSGQAAVDSVLAATGSSTAAFSGQAAIDGTLATGGVSTAAFVGQAATAANGVMATSGTTTAAFVNATAANAVLATGGTSTSAFVGSSVSATLTSAAFTMGGSSTQAFVSPALPIAGATMYMHFGDDVYVGAVPANITVVRNLAAYARNRAGQLIQFGSNTLRKTDLGVFTEEGRTNLLLQSQTFDNASWSKINGSTIAANAIAAPDGTPTADLWQRTATSSSHANQVVTKAATATLYGYSIYLKQFSTFGFASLRLQGSFPFNANLILNFATGAATVSDGGTSTGSVGQVEALADGWYRVTLAWTSDTSTAVQAFISGASQSQLIDGTDVVSNSGVYVWGAQLEAVATGNQYYPSSLIATTTVAVTRPKDDLRITGTSFSNWYTGGTAGSGGTSIGTAYIEFIAPPVSNGNQFLFDYTQGTGITDENGIYVNTTRGSSAIVNTGGVNQAQVLRSGIIGTVGSVVREASAWAKDDVRHWSNGAQVLPPDITVDTPPANQFAIGQRSDGTFPFNGFIRCIAYAPFTSGNFALYSITLQPNVLPGAIFDWGLDTGNYYGLPSTALSFTRATVGWAPNSAGDLIPFATGVPRITDLGLWVEEARTNQIRNNTMQGAVAGTVGSGGSLPTNWGTFTTATGITISTSAQGIEGNIEYIDVRFQGTPSASTTMQLLPETGLTITIPTSTVQTWSNGWYFKVVGGSLANVSAWTLGLDEDTSVGGFVTNKTVAINAPPTTGALGLSRQVIVLTTGGGSTVARLVPWIRFAMTSGQAIDMTIRVGLPCFEQGAFPQTAIKTINAAVTRNTDVPNITGANFYNVFNTLAGGMYVEGTPQFGSAASRRMIDINDGSASNRFLLAQSSTANTGRGLVTSGGSAVADMFATTLTGLANNKLAMAYAVDNYTTVINNGSAVSDALGALPVLGTTGQLSIGIDHAGSAASANGGPIKRIALYAFRPSTPQLGQITTVGTIAAFGSAGSSSGSFNGSGAAPSSGTFTITGSTTIAFVGQGAAASVLSANGLSTASFVGQAAAGSNGVINTSGNSTASFIGSALKPAVLTASGTTTATFAGQAAATSSFAISGVTSLAFVGQGLTLATGALSTSGSGTATFLSSALAPTVLNATGITTAAFAGQSVSGANSVLSASGSSTAAFIGSALKPSVLGALGVGSAAFVGQGLIAANGVLNTSGTGTATFLSSATAPSVLATFGTSTVSFFTGAAQAASFAITGSTTASFAGASNRAALLQANGLTTSAFASAVSLGANGVINPGGSSTASFFSSATKPSVLSSGGSTTAAFSSTSTAQSRVNATGSTTILFTGSTIRNLTAAQHMQFGQVATITGSSLDGPPIWLEGSIGPDDSLTGSIDADIIYGEIDDYELEGEV